MKRLVVVTTLMIVLCGLVRAQECQLNTLPVVKQFHAGEFTGPAGDRLPFRLFLPAIEAGRHYPLLLFLHGSGEYGDDNVKQLKNVVTKLTSAAVQAKYPCFILAPQSRHGWMTSEAYMGSNPQTVETRVMRLTIELLDALLATHPAIDRERIYVSGLSSGGSGTWDIIERYPHVFAAAIPMSGSGDASKAEKLVHLPIWAFHGANDIITRPSTTQAMIDAITAAGGHPRMTLFQDTGHAAWDRVFTDRQVLQWLFEQRRSAH